jgi:hypothetical protein
MPRTILIAGGVAIGAWALAAGSASASCSSSVATGTIVGGVGGALVGNAVGHAPGAFVGGLSGAVIGHEIGRSGCRRYGYAYYRAPRRTYGYAAPHVRAPAAYPAPSIYYDPYGRPIRAGPAAYATGYGACRTESRAFYDERGVLVERTAQVCDR